MGKQRWQQAIIAGVPYFSRSPFQGQYGQYGVFHIVIILSISPSLSSSLSTSAPSSAIDNGMRGQETTLCAQQSDGAQALFPPGKVAGGAVAAVPFSQLCRL